MTKQTVLQITYQNGTQYNIGCKNKKGAMRLRESVKQDALKTRRTWIDVIPTLQLLREDFVQQARSLEIFEVEAERKEREEDENSFEQEQ